MTSRWNHLVEASLLVVPPQRRRGPVPDGGEQFAQGDEAIPVALIVARTSRRRVGTAKESGIVSGDCVRPERAFAGVEDRSAAQVHLGQLPWALHLCKSASCKDGSQAATSFNALRSEP
jgi:hypothetical protein